MSPYPPPQDTPPSPEPTGLPIPLGKPMWVFILLGLIIFIFVVEMVLPYLSPLFVDQLPDRYRLIKQGQPLSDADFLGQASRSLVLIVMGANFMPFIQMGEVWRFFTAMFVHVDLTHLLFNAFALFAFGAETERIFGRSRFIAIYVMAGLFGSLASFTFSDALISAGASGAIFGIIGMQAAYFLKYRNTLGEFGRSRLSSVAIILVINIFFGLSQPNIDNWAHMGGLIAGFLLGMSMAPRYRAIDLYTTSARIVDEANVWLQWLALGLALVLLFGGTILALLFT